MNTVSWPASLVLSVIVVTLGALVWHGVLNAHTITAVSGALVGFSSAARASAPRSPISTKFHAGVKVGRRPTGSTVAIAA